MSHNTITKWGLNRLEFFSKSWLDSKIAKEKATRWQVVILKQARKTGDNFLLMEQKGRRFRFDNQGF